MVRVAWIELRERVGDTKCGGFSASCAIVPARRIGVSWQRTGLCLRELGRYYPVTDISTYSAGQFSGHAGKKEAMQRG